MLRIIKRLFGFKKKQNCKIDGKDISWEDTSSFTLPITDCRVIKVYDGDTITIASKLPIKNSPLYRFSVRLNGVDAPEIKGVNITEEEKNAAHQCQEYLSNLILNKHITLKNVKNEKYGRILADVYLNDIFINEHLLKERYVVAYNGKTKSKPASWLKYKLTGEVN